MGIILKKKKQKTKQKTKFVFREELLEDVMSVVCTADIYGHQEGQGSGQYG